MRKWNCVGHLLRRSDDCQTVVRRKVQPKKTLKRDVDEQMWIAGFWNSWTKMEVAAQDRVGWRHTVCGSDKACQLVILCDAPSDFAVLKVGLSQSLVS